MTIHRFWNLLLALGLALTGGAAASAAGSNAPGLQTAAYRIETDETRANFNSGDFTMPHKVRFYRPGTDAVGDRAQGNSKRGTVSLFGNVVVHDSGNANEAGEAAYKGSGPATLTCDRLDVDSKARVYTATGHFHFSQGTRNGSADRALLDRSAGTLHLEGNVRLSDNGETVTSNVVDYNLNSKDVQTHGSPTVITQPVNQSPGSGAREVPAAGHTAAPRRAPAAARAPSPKPSRKP